MKRWSAREVIGAVVVVLGYSVVLAAWGDAAALRVGLGFLLFAACSNVWEYKGRGGGLDVRGVYSLPMWIGEGPLRPVLASCGKVR
jgi:hypothetical protein